jgi:hypothetical protein
MPERFETLKEFPPMRGPETDNLTQVTDMIKAGASHPADKLPRFEGHVNKAERPRMGAFA